MNETTDADDPTAQRRGAAWLITPVLVFAAIAALFAVALKVGDPSRLPSALLGKPVPAIDYAAVEGLSDEGRVVPGFKHGDLAQGQVSVVNFWASWCAPCVQEHAVLLDLKHRTAVAIYGVNYKDQADDARRFLGRYGNPYRAVGSDASGRSGIDWGVYGTPETFVIDGEGKVAFKHVGPITSESLVAQIIPAIEKARAKTAVR